MFYTCSMLVTCCHMSHDGHMLCSILTCSMLVTFCHMFYTHMSHAVICSILHVPCCHMFYFYTHMSHAGHMFYTHISQAGHMLSHVPCRSHVLYSHVPSWSHAVICPMLVTCYVLHGPCWSHAMFYHMFQAMFYTHMFHAGHMLCSILTCPMLIICSHMLCFICPMLVTCCHMFHAGVGCSGVLTVCMTCMLMLCWRLFYKFRLIILP